MDRGRRSYAAYRTAHSHFLLMLRLQGLNWSQHGRWAYEWALPQNGSRFCRLVHPGSGGKTGISTMLSKEAGGGSALPGGDGTSRAECLTLIYFPPHSPLQSVAPVLWKFSFSPYLHLISSLAPALLPSPGGFSGERLRPQQPVCASAEITSIFSGVGYIILLLPIIIATCATSAFPP